MEKKYYGVCHRSREVWQKSSSGGAFTALTDAWFNAYGEKAAVYGCILDEDLKARHIRAAAPDQRDRMRGSKYISSDLTGIYSQVEADLKAGNYVLFSGTPCQIAAVSACLKAKKTDLWDHLLTVEVICHGVGSSRFFEDYIANLERIYKSKAVSCSFRGKSRPEKIQEMYVTFENGKKYISPAARYDWFYTAYLKNYVLRPSCYQCRFATMERLADISMADHWQAAEGLARSLLIANTRMGDTWIGKSNAELALIELREPDIYVPNMIAPSNKPEDYDLFWKKYCSEGYLAAQTWLGNNTYKTKCKHAAADILYRLHITSAVKQLRRRLRK